MLFRSGLVLALFFPDNSLLISITIAINMISTTAFVISDPVITTNYLPAAIFFLPVLIGGMTLSTAGGLKVLRFYLLIKRVTYEVVNLPYPNSVESMHYGGKFVSKETMASVWGLFLMYFIGFVGSFLILSFLTSDFESAWLLALALLNNAEGAEVVTPTAVVWCEKPKLASRTLASSAGRRRRSMVCLASASSAEIGRAHV